MYHVKLVGDMWFVLNIYRFYQLKFFLCVSNIKILKSTLDKKIRLLFAQCQKQQFVIKRCLMCQEYVCVKLLSCLIVEFAILCGS